MNSKLVKVPENILKLGHAEYAKRLVCVTYNLSEYIKPNRKGNWLLVIKILRKWVLTSTLKRHCHLLEALMNDLSLPLTKP